MSKFTRKFISKELRALKVTPRFMKNVKEMLKYHAKGRERNVKLSR